MSARRNAMRRALLVAAGCALLLAAVRGCSLEPSAEAPGGSAADASDARMDGPPDAHADVKHDTDSGEDGAEADVQDPTKPASVPNGWKFYPDYDPQCTLWYSPSKDLMPAPIAWEACKNPIGPDGMVCRQMVVDWDEYAPDFPIAAAPTAVVLNNKSTLLQLARTTNNGVFWLVAEADGSVRQALFGVDQSCILGSQQMDGEHVAWRVFDDVPKEDDTYGAIASTLEEVRPRPYRSQTDVFVTYPYVPGPYGLLENGVDIYDWTTGELAWTFHNDPEDAGMLPFNHFFAGGALFWTVSSSVTERLKVWTPQDGVRTFQTQGDDVHSAVAGLCSDGTDMMWAVGEERTAKLEPYQKVTLHTAKFASDPTALEPRRLRSDFPGTTVFEPCVVGCGYAARPTYEDPTFAAVRLIRLSDGWSWLLKSDYVADDWRWHLPIALSCDEVFITVKTPAWNIARVRLDSLGPGEPPD